MLEYYAVIWNVRINIVFFLYAQFNIQIPNKNRRQRDACLMSDDTHYPSYYTQGDYL